LKLAGPGIGEERNFHAPPPGWRKHKALRLVGVGTPEWAANQPGTPAARVIGGSLTDPARPALWLSATSAPIHIENIKFGPLAVPIRIGVGSPAKNRGEIGPHSPAPPARDQTCAYVRFSGCSMSCTQEKYSGPAMDIGAVIGLWIERCGFEANAKLLHTADNRAAILIKADTPTLGGIHISDCNFNMGGIKYYPGSNGYDISVERVFQEGNYTDEFLPPTVHMLDTPTVGCAYFNDVGTEDGPFECNIKIEGAGASAESIVCVKVASVVGPATLLATPVQAWGSRTRTPAGARQLGFWRGRVAAQHDSARRTFGPTAVRFRNQARQDPRTWASVEDPSRGAHVTLGQPAPDGTRNAARLSTTAEGDQTSRVMELRWTPNDGDYVVAGVWYRADGPPPLVQPGIANIAFLDSNYQIANGLGLSLVTQLQGDGEWEWVYVVGKVTRKPGAAPNPHLAMDLITSKTTPRHFYAPLVLTIAAGDASENEIAEIAQHASSWTDAMPAGTVSLLRDQDFGIQGHVLTEGATLVGPSPELGAGRHATVEVSGNDISGSFTLVTGADGVDVGPLATVQFRRHYEQGPQVVLTAGNANAGANAPGFYVTTTKATFTLRAAARPAPATEYKFFYHVLA
jgi:hypothetical protein